MNDYIREVSEVEFMFILQMKFYNLFIFVDTTSIISET